MQVSRRRCEAVKSTDRRKLLIGATLLGAFELLPPLFRQGAVEKATEGRTRLSELIEENDLATARAHALVGQTVSLRGYLSPALRSGVALDLYERSPAPCLACGFIHDPGRSLPVLSNGVSESPNPLRLTEISGSIEIDGRGRVLLRA